MGRKIAVLVLVFAGFYLAGHYWIRWRSRITNDAQKVSQLLQCEPDQIRRVKITQQFNGKTEVFEFERVDTPEKGIPLSAQMANSEWSFVSPAKGEADSGVLSRMAAAICETYDPIPVKDQEPALDPKGRMAQKVEFELVGDDGTRVQELQFLTLTNDRMVVTRYIADSSAKAYKILPLIFQMASQNPDAFVNYRVVRMTPDNIQAASVIFDGRERFTLERDGSEWKVLSKGKVAGKGSEEAGKFVNRIATLRALEIKNPSFTAEECESTPHKIRIELSGVANRREALYVSAPAKQGLSACSTGRRAKFLVHSDLMKYLDQPLKKLVRAN